MLCEKCQIREATVHCTVCTGAADDGPKRTDLCDQCFEVSDLRVAMDMPADFQASLQAGCRYCGGEFHSGGFDPNALLGGVRKISVMCKPCAKEYYDFLGLKLPGFGDCNLTEEQQALMMANLKACDFPAVILELDDHMKEWVAKRKSQ